MSDNDNSGNSIKNGKKTSILLTILFFLKKKKEKLIELSVIRQYLSELKSEERDILDKIKEFDRRLSKEVTENIELIKDDLNIKDNNKDSY